ncbi:MAG: Ldh family oxidoreductase [candidate division NC10 bacterium]
MGLRAGRSDGGDATRHQQSPPEHDGGGDRDGSLFLALNVAAFRPLDEFRAEVTDFAKFLKSSRPAKGFREVLYPGEIEWRTRQERLETGIPIEDETWTEVQELAASMDVSTA